MKKFIVVLICLMALAGCAQSVPTLTPTPTPSFTLNIPDWLTFGMQEGDVRGHYEKEPVTYKTTIAYVYQQYKGYKNQINYGTYYGFSSDSDKLVLLSYAIDFDGSASPLPIDKRPYLTEYNWIKDQITNIYGAPESSQDNWANTRYENDPSMKNQAIANGEYTISTLWESNNIYISLKLYKDITINYTNDKTEWY